MASSNPFTRPTEGDIGETTMMIKNFRKSEKGFTLIELMIVVAIIGILAAIAIPNFIRFQLKAKSSEGKVNLAAIRTAEEGYMAEYGTYVAAAVSPAAIPGSTKASFVNGAGAGAGFDQLGWSPEGKVYFQYGVVIDTTNAAFAASAAANIDSAGDNQGWAYIKTGNVETPLNGGCVATGTWDGTLATPAATLTDTVGPCDGGSGQSVF
jgi:type IV pilus assembly protein PilA